MLFKSNWGRICDILSCDVSWYWPFWWQALFNWSVRHFKSNRTPLSGNQIYLDWKNHIVSRRDDWLAAIRQSHLTQSKLETLRTIDTIYRSLMFIFSPCHTCLILSIGFMKYLRDSILPLSPCCLSVTVSKCRPIALCTNKDINSVTYARNICFGKVGIGSLNIIDDWPLPSEMKLLFTEKDSVDLLLWNVRIIWNCVLSIQRRWL